MGNLRTVTDLAECRQVWEQLFPRDLLPDLWELRACFQQHYRRPAHFLLSEGPHGIDGLLPLSWIEESQCYGYFPGETWEGKTWLEQNRVLARSRATLQELLQRVPSHYHVRYLLPIDSVPQDQHTVDEIGYLFLPPKYQYDIENYFQEFSGKSAKRLKRELAALEGRGVSFRYDTLSDYDHLVRLNISGFGPRSYFSDPRFTESFRSLVQLLHERGWLRITTILVNGEPAAVDMGCIYRGIYTLLGGGTHAAHTGVAKLINIHHMRRACEERLEQADFLCGDFSWKKLFHLTPRPLYLLCNAPAHVHHADAQRVGSSSGGH